MKRVLVFLLALSLVCIPTSLFAKNGSGFDEYGYNYQARIFVGPADGVDRSLDGAVWGDPTYANDHLLMKWSKAWDDARFHGAPWTSEAWVDNEWNGMVPGGSGEVWHSKIIWVGPELESSPSPNPSLVKDVNYLPPLGFQRLGDEPAVALPGEALGAHDNSVQPRGNFFQAPNSFLKFLALHVCLIAALAKSPELFS